MSQPARVVSGQLRLLRGLLLGIAMVLLTATAHAGAHGQLPDAGALGLLTVISVGLGTIAMERPRGISWFLLYAMGMQTLLHVLLVTTTAHTAHGNSLVPSASMVLAHVLAAGALAVLLAHADAVLLRFVFYMRTVLFALIRPLVLHVPWQTDNFTAVTPLLPQVTIKFAIARRGPPARSQ
ncbi:MAG: hypothetical protein Q7K25_03985 [Actinomycetota bacterium]|nr:hypothetical protein [Actinomycetota bacterium]